MTTRKKSTTEKINLPTILIVDDEQKNIDEISHLLTEYPFKINPVLDGALAFDIAQATNPKMIIMSVDMPQGFYHSGKFKKDKFVKKIPLILTSSKVTPKTFQEHRRLPTRADGYLIRPFSSLEFLKICSEVLPEDFPPLEDEEFKLEPQKIDDTPPEINSKLIDIYPQDEIGTLKATIAQLVDEREKLREKIRSLGGISGEFQLPSMPQEELMEIAEEGDMTPVNGVTAGKEASIEKIAAKANLIAELEEMIKFLKEDNKILIEEKESQLELFSQLESSYKEQIRNLKNEKEEYLKSIDELTVKLSIVENQLLEKEAQIKESEEEIYKERMELKDLKEKLEKFKEIEREVTKIPELYQELTHKKELEDEVFKLREAAIEIESLKKKAEELENLKSIAKEIEELRPLKDKIKSLEEEKETFIKEKIEIDKKLKDSEERVEELKERVKHLNKIISSIKSITGSGES